MQHYYWPLVFSLATPLTLVASFLILSSLPIPSTHHQAIPQVLSSSVSPNSNSITSFVTAADARPAILENYLRLHKSPLVDFSTELVQLADKYKLDYRLLIAIARQESNLCKRIPPGSHNCWGYNIYGDNMTAFPDFTTGAERVAQLLVKYKNQGLHTPEQIMTRYTPPSAAGDGSWAKGVNAFLADLQ